MTREFTNTQRHVLALMHLAQAVDNMNTIVYTDETKPELPGLNDYPVDIFIQTLTGHISYATAQFSALMHDAAKRIVDDADDEVDELQRLVAAYRQRDVWRDVARRAFGVEAGHDMSSLFEAIFRTPASDFAKPEPVDPEPLPEGIFYNPTNASFVTADGTNYDDHGGAEDDCTFYLKWFDRYHEFPVYQQAPSAAPDPVAEPTPDPVAEPTPDPAQARVEGTTVDDTVARAT